MWYFRKKKTITQISVIKSRTKGINNHFYVEDVNNKKKDAKDSTIKISTKQKCLFNWIKDVKVTSTTTELFNGRKAWIFVIKNGTQWHFLS